MCIVCDMEKLNKLHANAAESLVKSLANVTHDLIKALESKSLDDKEHALINEAKRIMRGVDDQPDENRAGAIVEALQKAFPGAKVVVGSPDEVEAMLQREVSEANGHKPN